MQPKPHTAEPTAIFEKMPVPAALAKMALPTIASQLIALIYSLADTWFIGQTDNPYMVGGVSLVTSVFWVTIVLASLFGTGGGTLVVQLLGSRNEDEARKVASLSLVMAFGATLAFSLGCLVLMNPLLHLLGASSNTLPFARQYLFFVVVLGALPTVLSNTMSSLVRNTGHSREAGFGLSMGGILNVILDPLFMFVLLPTGYEVMGAAIATMLSNTAAFVYYLLVFRKLRHSTVLSLPRRIARVRRESLRSVFAVGVPAATSVLLFDITNIIINRLAASHGDIELAAIGIVLKAERLPLNIGIGICLGMVPLVAYNFAAKNYKRMYACFSAARIAGVAIAVASVILYRLCAPYIVRAFISDAETVRLGTEFLQARCFATPFMFLSFHMVHFMQSVKKGNVSFLLAVIRQLCLNIPILLLMNYLLGMTGIVWTQVTADILNVTASYLIYFRVKKTL